MKSEIKKVWHLSQSPVTAKNLGRGLGFGLWYKSIKDTKGIGGNIVANAYGKTKEEAEFSAKSIVDLHNNNQ